MKKLLSILLALTLAFSLTLPAFAAEEVKVSEDGEWIGDVEHSEYDRGWNDGYDKGFSEGFEKGKADQAAGMPWDEDEDPEGTDREDGTYQEGYDDGYASGRSYGYSEGYVAQYEAGYDAAYEKSYGAGYEAGQADGCTRTPVDPEDSVPPLGDLDDYSYECGVKDGTHYGYIMGYEDGYLDASGHSCEEDYDVIAKGGIPGQINVMFEDDMVRFPDQQPEIRNGRTMVPVRAVMESMGAQVDYDVSGKTVTIRLNDAVTVFTVGSDRFTVTKDGQTSAEKMDCACYIAGRRAMVPVRFLSEASGYEVLWDQAHRTAVIVDAQSLAAEIDESFTHINSILAARLTANQGKKQESETTFDLKVTLYDEDGKAVVLPLTGTLVTHTDGTAFRVKLTLDTGEAVKAILKNGLTLLDDVSVSLRTALQEDLTKLSATLILDEQGDLYLQAPVLLELLGNAPMENDQWLYLGNVCQYGVDMDQISDGTMTVGSLLTAALLQDETAFGYRESLDEAAAILEAVFGDSIAQAENDGYAWSFDMDSVLAAAGAEDPDEESLEGVDLAGSFFADPKGNYRLALDLQAGDEETGILSLSLQASGTETRGELAFRLSVPEAIDLELTGRSTTRTVNNLPDLALPADAEIVEQETGLALNAY